MRALGQHYGFGAFTKKPVQLQRRLLPDAQLSNVSIAVVFDRGNGGLDAAVFASQLETLITQNGSGIRLVSRNPQYEIRCYPTNVQRPHIQTQTDNKVTTRTAFGEIAMDARIVRASDGFVKLSFRESAVLSASSAENDDKLFKMLHVPGVGLPTWHKQGAAPDTPPITTEPLDNTETDETLNARLLRTLALHVASHMTQMDETIPVMLAQGGALDSADKLAQASRWTEYLESLKNAAPANTPADDAYRLYDIGVANEALGYNASTPQIALKYLNEASLQYNRAAENRPSEKYFLPPKKRIEVAITRYNNFKSDGGVADPGNGGTPTADTSPERFTNADVIKLVKANVPKSIIAGKISSTPDAQFDLSTDGLIALSSAGVGPDLIEMMRRVSAAQQQGRR